MTRIKINEPTKRKCYRELVVTAGERYGLLPAVARIGKERRCSRCGGWCRVDGLEDYLKHVHTARSATKEPVFVLETVLCDACWESNQRRVEKLCGFKRGDRVQMGKRFGENVVEIDHFYDETMFVDNHGVVQHIEGIEKRMPKQTSIFDFAA